MQVNLSDPPLNQGIPVFGNQVSQHEFQGVLTHGLFKMLVPDPQRLEGTMAKYNQDLSGVASLRGRVQRLVTGAKKKNVEPYAKYILTQAKTEEGFTPQIVLWCQQALKIEVDQNTGFGWALVPHELKFVALDGDTQTAARNLADRMSPGVLDKQTVKVVLRHGTPEDVAQQIFADCNSQGVKVTTSMAIGLDNRDDATQLVKFVEKAIPALAGKVNRQKRQLGATDKDVLTISALRASVVCFIEGIAGVQSQTKSVEIDDKRMGDLRPAALAWYEAVTDVLDGALTQGERSNNFAASPAVWCAIGAMGHDTLVELFGTDYTKSVTPAALQHAFKALAQDKLVGVDWSRGSQWLAVGAKQSGSGAVTLGGPKEAGSLVYKAIKEGTLLKAIA